MSNLRIEVEYEYGVDAVHNIVDADSWVHADEPH
jgi:hypothetical protein